MLDTYSLSFSLGILYQYLFLVLLTQAYVKIAQAISSRPVSKAILFHSFLHLLYYPGKCIFI